MVTSTATRLYFVSGETVVVPESLGNVSSLMASVDPGVVEYPDAAHGGLVVNYAHVTHAVAER